MIEQKNESVTETTTKLEERKNHLQHKKDELDAILAETQKEEELLLEKSKEYEKKAGNIHPSYSCPFLGHLGWRENKQLPVVIHCGNTCRRFFSTQEKQVTYYLVWIDNSFF